MHKKILITGVNGQVGHALAQVFANDSSPERKVFLLDRNQLDLSNKDEIRRIVQEIHPDLIINPAAYTAVDKAETEPELAFAINAFAPQILAEEAAKIGSKIIHFSTDYVYNGTKPTWYVEDDNTDPLGVYGQSKLAGENAIRAVGLPHLIFRTSWVYGAYGKNFLNTILRLSKEREELRIVSDQIGAPTSSASIADATFNAINVWDNDLSGVYHLVNAGETSWHGFAKAIVEEYSHLQKVNAWPELKVKAANIHGITTKEFPTPAKRPTNSKLNCNKLERDLSIELSNWRFALVAELLKLKP